MKNPVISCMQYPYDDKLVVIVHRGDGKHIPKAHLYSCYYSDTGRVHNLATHASSLYNKITLRLLKEKLKKEN